MHKTIFTISFLMLSLILFINCDVNTKNTDKTQSIILFPFVSPDSIKIYNKELKFVYIDSTPFYNPVTSRQAILLYTIQREPDTIVYEKLTIKIKMPNRANSVIEYSMSKPEFQKLERNINNPILKPFYKEFLELNWDSRKNYEDRFMSLLDRTNMIFADKIEERYKEQIPNNSIWFGYDSFSVFEQYFKDIQSGKSGIAKELVESIESSTKYLVESDRKMLSDIIKKHTERIKQK